MRNFIINIVALMLISCQSDSQHILRIQSLLKEKTGIFLSKEEIELKQYKSDQAMDDFTEQYEIFIPDSSHIRILHFVKSDSSWEKIEKGYQRSILIEDTEKKAGGYMAYIFLVDEESNVLYIQVIQE